jgi:hypothetical protein
MNILYLGDDDPHCSASQRAAALTRLGHRVRHVSPARALSTSRVIGKLHYLTGYALALSQIARYVLAEGGREPFDLAWVDGGATVSRELVLALRERCGRVVNYNLDDPTGERDGGFWRTFQRALPAYDFCVVVREESAHEYRKLGARAVLQVYRGYDEVAHASRPASEAAAARWRGQILFVGTWMPERSGLLLPLVSAGLPLAIYGNRWEKAPEAQALRGVLRGPALVGADYVNAIQHAAINLGLVSRGNRDQHTQRSAEIPFIGGLLCAERTREHLAMFREDHEAVFWANPSECVEKCRWLLANPAQGQAIAAAGQRRIRALGVGNEAMLARVLAHCEPPALKRKAVLCN